MRPNFSASFCPLCLSVSRLNGFVLLSRAHIAATFCLISVGGKHVDQIKKIIKYEFGRNHSIFGSMIPKSGSNIKCLTSRNISYGMIKLLLSLFFPKFLHKSNFDDNESTHDESDVEPLKLSEILNIIPEFDENTTILSTFINSLVQKVCVGQQKFSETIQIKNKLKGKAVYLVNSRKLKNMEQNKNVTRITLRKFKRFVFSSPIHDLQKH